MTRWVLAAVLLSGVLLSCGGGEDEAAQSGCPALDADEPVTLRVPYGDVDLAREWDALEPGVVLDLRDGEPPTDMALRMTGDDPHALTSLPAWMTEAVEASGAVRRSTECFPAVRLYAGAWLLAYDRAAFERAGLDPASPPSTFDELHAAGVALRDRADISSPISWDPAPVALFELDLATEEAERAARAWTRLGVDGLLHERRPDSLPPLGTGEAALQVLWSDEVWSYAEAIGQGQAPRADFGVALVPGVDGPQSTIEPFDWVVSADASPAEEVAAAAFLRWLGEPAQLLRVHREHGLLPADPVAAENDGFTSYWEDRPLLREAWDVLQTMPSKRPRGDVESSGDWPTITENLRAVVRGELEFEAAWDMVVRLGRRAAAANERDPLAVLRCTAGPPDGEPRRLVDCV
jgi:ABC-type glycerol-3-phosphate transport system substrate-binding protein